MTQSIRVNRLLMVLAASAMLVACGAPAATPVSTPAPAQPASAKADAVEIFRDPNEVPKPITRTTPETVKVNLEVQEVSGKLADGVTYTYWTFGGHVPGPMIRARVGDTIEIHLKNNPKNQLVHSIDLHAVTGPGGGAVAMQTKPGEEKTFSFKALNPGTYVYHCASPHIPTHIAEGMYGMIVIEPAGGLAPVDKEFYVMQGEVYSEGNQDAKGDLKFDGDKLFHEQPNYVVFNGSFQALAKHPMKAKVGDKIRIFFGNGGPSLISSFHIIGVIFDKVYPEAASEPQTNVQTTLVPVAGATVVEFTAKVPGSYTLVDHSIIRAINKGAVGSIIVEGPENKEVFNASSTGKEG